MLDEYLTDEQYDEKPIELEVVDPTKIYEKPFISECQETIEETFHTENRDKCIGCQFQFTDPSQCKNC